MTPHMSMKNPCDHPLRKVFLNQYFQKKKNLSVILLNHTKMTLSPSPNVWSPTVRLASCCTALVDAVFDLLPFFLLYRLSSAKCLLLRTVALLPTTCIAAQQGCALPFDLQPNEHVRVMCTFVSLYCCGMKGTTFRVYYFWMANVFVLVQRLRSSTLCLRRTTLSLSALMMHYWEEILHRMLTAHIVLQRLFDYFFPSVFLFHCCLSFSVVADCTPWFWSLPYAIPLLLLCFCC